MSGSFRISEHLIPEITGVLDCIKDPAIALSTDYRILAANQAYRATYSDGKPLLGRHCYEVSHHYDAPCDQSGESCPLADCLKTGKRQRVFHVHHTPRGEEHVDVETRPVRDEQGQLRYLIEIMRETRSASSQTSPEGMVGRSRTFNHMLEMIHRVAPTEASVLLQGESGTGKELVARAIHENSARAERPFVVVECSGLTESLFESELFGHERGAFTGASSRKTGLVESAEGGTLFLDEVGDVPLALQVKLLRLLETGTYRRVGSVAPRRADFRLVSASHRALKSMVGAGTFRQDLYYRIGTFPIDLPALRQRRDDLPLLIDSLLVRLAGGRDIQISAEAMACLAQYDFPGNIRELRNLLERAIILADDDLLLPRHLPAECCGPMAQEDALSTADAGISDDERILPLDEVERRYLRQVVARYSGDRDSLARQLGISKRTLFRKLQLLAAD